MIKLEVPSPLQFNSSGYKYSSGLLKTLLPDSREGVCNTDNADGPENAEINPGETSKGTDKTYSTESSPTTQKERTLENRPKRAAA